MSIKFVNITEPEFLSKRLLFKYMPLEFALATIKDRYLWLCNPTIWRDPFEKRFINAKYIDRRQETEFPLKGRVFCTCLTQTITSEAHWNNYPNGKLGVSFRIKRKELLDILNTHTNDYDFFIGSVNYLTTTNVKKSKISEIGTLKNIVPFKITNRDLQIQLLLLKRVAFKYEDEIRILAIKKHKTKEEGIKLPFKMSPTNLIERVTIDPNAEKHTEEMLKNIFKNEYGFKNVFKSQLYTTGNDITITL